MTVVCNFTPPRCKHFSILKQEYDKIVKFDHNQSYINALLKFDSIAEEKLRDIIRRKQSKGVDQAWKSCKGYLYEYAVCKTIEYIFNVIPGLSQKLSVVHGSILGQDYSEYKDQITIRNWTDIIPDADFVIIDNEEKIVKAIISCKTSIRERLTETAFWKRELVNKEIQYIFITTDKDDEIKTDTNRYIVMHVIDYTIITDEEQLNKIITHWRERYGNREDFNQIMKKIGGIKKLCELFCQYSGMQISSDECSRCGNM